MKIDLYSIPSSRRLLLGLGLSAAFSFSVVLAAFSIPAVGVIEWRLADLWAQKAHGRTISRHVAVVGVDEALLNQFGWPLEKDIYGDLVSYLFEMGAHAVAFDVLFADNLDDCGKRDSIFREIVRLYPNVVLCCGALPKDRGVGVLPGRAAAAPRRFAVGRSIGRSVAVGGAVLPYPALLANTTHIGFLNQARPLTDGIDRAMPVLFSQDSLAFPSLALSAACAGDSMTSGRISLVNGNVEVRGKILPIEADGCMFVNFSDSIPAFDISEVRASHRAWLLGQTPSIGRDQLQGRVVFIGNTALSLGDFGVTPLTAREASGRSPNVMMHAQSAASIIEGSGIRFHGRLFAVLFSAILVLCVCALLYTMPSALALLCAGILFALCVLGSQQLYLACHFIPILEGISASFLFCVFGSLAVYFEKELDRKYLYAVFGQYLSTHIISEMHRKQTRPRLGGEEVFATAFFTDIEGFSSFSEEMSPATLIKNLNEYFDAMTRVLLANAGTLDKFIGDAIVAFFGAPQPSHTHAHDACMAAVRMQETLSALRERWSRTEGIHDKVKKLKMRIGINTGRFVTGNIGCETRMNYTMIGDTVNLAARLESACKEYGVCTLVGEETYQIVRHDFRFRRLDKIQVKGRGKGTFVYQLMGVPRDGDEWIATLNLRYDEALDRYMTGRFKEAAELFDAARTLEKHSDAANPSIVLRDRCLHLARIMPENWDGIFRMKTK